MKNKSHIKFEGKTITNIFKTTKPGRGKKYIEKSNDRLSHGNVLLQKANDLKHSFDNLDINPLLIKDDSVYIEFTSDWGYQLSFDSFDKSGFQLLNINEEIKIIDNVEQYRYSLVVLASEGDISNFIKKIEIYLSQNFIKTDRITKEKIDTGEPKNKKLLNNIDDIKVASLKSFWVDGLYFPFPNENEDVWWEVWFRKSDNYIEKLNSVYNNLEIIGCQIGQSQIELAEYIVKLVKGTSKQLSDSLLLLDNLAELRKPQEISNFITDKFISFETKKEYLEDLQNRTINNLDEKSVLICLLDSGVNNKHPLLKNFISDENIYSFNEESWGVQDDLNHGTGVAGLSLYGDLTDALSTSDSIQIFHGLESFKIITAKNVNDPELYGAITESGISTPQIYKPSNLRVYCMTVTDKHIRFNGRPSSWSSAVDKICFGKELGQQLFIMSGGNVKINKHDDYPKINQTECIHDPAQAYNALTIGTYTRKDKIDISTAHKPLVEYGGMAPSNSTSLLFENSWPNKPDLVFEGGNRSTDGVYTSDHSELRLLTTDADFRNDIFMPFGDTSGAAGLAAKMAAELRTNYPNYWVETIRGLMVHSADWTNSMKKNIEKKNLLRTVGYGVANIQKAMFSVENSLTLIAEREIQPYKYEKSEGKYNEYHLFNLPWPKEALESLEEKSVKLIVTLSYYIEPNPGSRRLATHYSYHSHQLDFELIKRYETLPEFQKRISKPEDETKDNKPKRDGVKWEIGPKSGSKGSIRKDFITTTGREMSERNTLAVFPKNGWYKNLKRQNKFNEKVRYSLIVSLETEEFNIDLYTPVMNQLSVPL